MVYKLQNAHQARMGHNMVKPSSPNAPSAWLIFLLPPYSCFPTEFASILLPVFSLFALVAAISQCLCSENPYLSIKHYLIYVCYMNVTYIAFGIIRSFRVTLYLWVISSKTYHGYMVCLGTYYPQIQGTPVFERAECVGYVGRFKGFWPSVPWKEGW
jgi:hypothetical protein